jgi:hypothetical protein
VRKHRVGSSPTSGTSKFPAKVAKIRLAKEKPRCSRRGCLLQPYCNASAEGFFKGAGGAVLHVGEHVRVGVERNGYRSVTEKFLDELGVSPLSQQQCRAGVAKVVKANALGQIGTS